VSRVRRLIFSKVTSLHNPAPLRALSQAGAAEGQGEGEGAAGGRAGSPRGGGRGHLAGLDGRVEPALVKHVLEERLGAAPHAAAEARVVPARRA
jgi:hypothetical protein